MTLHTASEACRREERPQLPQSGEAEAQGQGSLIPRGHPEVAGVVRPELIFPCVGESSVPVVGEIFCKEFLRQPYVLLAELDTVHLPDAIVHDTEDSPEDHVLDMHPVASSFSNIHHRTSTSSRSTTESEVSM